MTWHSPAVVRMSKVKRMEGGGEGGEGGEAHIYSSVDCRASAVVVRVAGQHWASFRKSCCF